MSDPIVGEVYKVLTNYPVREIEKIVKDTRADAAWHGRPPPGEPVAAFLLAPPQMTAPASSRGPDGLGALTGERPRLKAGAGIT
ncbi:hypothetical protein [Wenxinia marina]|uniref:Uncharacterized protein n=1 Tax=Wenxinia marina DSM 24838 TaxID=1123501 RepID=A0A0D0Q493_9RHOB|nr:hypothetical protein [Wenxinia marina]KIQ69349.1 hypothetical protein Wenmar_01711 [Wenxinia marina DSM 24838]GGL57613.1 hypothetical protein GCM10011392_10070 [Wenxinia marina]